MAYLALQASQPGDAAHTHIHEIIAGLRAEGSHVTPFLAADGATARPLPLRAMGQICLQRHLMRRLREFDALYVRAHPLALPAAWAARRAGLPVVQEINGVTADIGVTHPWLRPLLRPLAALQRAQYRMADALLPVTRGLAHWAAGLAPGVPVHLIRNGANTALFTPHGARRPHPRPYAVFVGGLARWHGIGTMLAALGDPAWPRGVDLLVAGDGPDRETLRAALAAVPRDPAAPRLHWLRRLAYADVPALLRGATCALVPIENPDGRSSHGVLPLKLFEAMACGVPVLASDLPDQGDLVRQEGSGLVVPVGDAGALAAGVARLAAEPETARRLGAAGALAAHARHGWVHRAAEAHRVVAALAAARLPAAA